MHGGATAGIPQKVPPVGVEFLSILILRSLQLLYTAPIHVKGGADIKIGTPHATYHKYFGNCKLKIDFTPRPLPPLNFWDFYPKKIDPIHIYDYSRRPFYRNSFHQW